jgi:hypothetical protein
MHLVKDGENIVFIKRESGENPELSRSCKLHKPTSNCATVCSTNKREGQMKGSKSEDLPDVELFNGFRGLKPDSV